MIPYCSHHGIGIIPWGPLHGGNLARPGGSSTTRSEYMKGLNVGLNFTDAHNTIVDRVEEIAKKREWKMSQVALAWVSAKVASPIVGCSTVSRWSRGEGWEDTDWFVGTD